MTSDVLQEHKLVLRPKQTKRGQLVRSKKIRIGDMTAVPESNIMYTPVIVHQSCFKTFDCRGWHIGPYCATIEKSRHDQALEQLQAGANRKAFVQEYRGLHLFERLASRTKPGIDLLGDVQAHRVLGAKVLIGRHHTKREHVGVGGGHNDGQLVLVKDLGAKCRRARAPKAKNSLSLPSIEVQGKPTGTKETMNHL